jgi:hypothetical protein
MDGNLASGPGYNVMIHPTGTYYSPGETSPTALLVGGRILMGDSARDGVLRVSGTRPGSRPWTRIATAPP